MSRTPTALTPETEGVRDAAAALAASISEVRRLAEAYKVAQREVDRYTANRDAIIEEWNHADEEVRLYTAELNNALKDQEAARG